MVARCFPSNPDDMNDEELAAYINSLPDPPVPAEGEKAALHKLLEYAPRKVLCLAAWELLQEGVKADNPEQRDAKMAGFLCISRCLNGHS